MGFLPSVYTPPIPSSPSCRFRQHSTTGGHGERCKDPKRVQGRVPTDNTFWVGASDPIFGRLQQCFVTSLVGVEGVADIRVFTAQCTLVQSAVLRSHVVCLSVRLSVCNVGDLWSHRLEILETNCTIY